ncbi:helicase (nucleomorph) [Cryptomonas paramecium]|uniref:ATP-dependent RNA helicase n=1 Tax=Cryptomonas paramaecium TaxID=2898 RepID=F2HIG0_9CRYP|nr:helicase [Cryptomonas paramecium]AEA39084.1 helicase [Cryptomonas paramecium]|mmetsp:Transcript_37353/g.99449  ORF Transcript_37353/g.99449 Transcript_37353/m.99449 type:complete len:460 (+) Transcript_37353:10847-12226(+)
MSLDIKFEIVSEFKNLNISNSTIQSLSKLGYKKMTSIQKISIPPALMGFDVLGSAKTGSGKTLCFVIPVIEISLIQNYIQNDMLVNLVKSCILFPTRELGIQIFDFVKNIEAKIKIKLCLGKIMEKEKCSMVLSTPGSLFNHLNNKSLNLNQLKILAMDEADEILNTNFIKITDLLMFILPKKRQVLFFSATLNSKLKNITRINLKNPIFCSLNVKKMYFNKKKKYKYIQQIHNIRQFAVISHDYKKNAHLLSFLSSHKTQKIIIFVSTKKQIKYLYTVTKLIFPEIKTSLIYGSMNQTKRIKNFLKFSMNKRQGVLFSTDLTSRGLDFRSVEWIIQLDCPKNIQSYFHRIGRTGRFLETGKTILFLNYQEIKFINTLGKNFVKIHIINIYKRQIEITQKKIEILLKKNKNCTKIALDAFLSYAKFIYFQKNKICFEFKKFNWKKIAQNFGLNPISYDL